MEDERFQQKGKQGLLGFKRDAFRKHSMALCCIGGILDTDIQ